MAGEVFTPKRIITRGTIKKLVVPGAGGSMDGAANSPTDAEALTGAYTFTLAADPPGAFIFECHCGHMRRVTFTETNFRCERGGVGNDCTCPILWCRKMKDSGEIDPDSGKPIMVDDTTDETIEVVDDISGKRKKMRVPRPQFIGRLVGELRSEEFARRASRGEAPVANPTNEVVNLQYQTSKQQMDKRLADKAKADHK